MVPGIAELPQHVLCPRRWERAAPSLLPALGAGDSCGSLPCVSGLGGLRDGWMDGWTALGSCAGSGMGLCLQPGDALSREAFLELVLGPAWGWHRSPSEHAVGCCPALVLAPRPLP